ncbi:MAG: hypothetical protein HKO63_05130 [Acidimicrobiia bacterium]|nr:hypothetical protein [Acidimicrobiia bacterium]MBT8192736.1 hypothetical protein [Acidimicrobiia bacterium]NNF88461.1 hypothetical protein [Acidimicrobiia bacterium]NNL13482.1 hypothetical protein [Acidimicrobiia bacterium]NNL97569.1 hypothetical protein [Acidimicrobiia bacterium]
MRRLLVVLTALLMLAVLAAPAAAKPGNSDTPEKPGKPGPSLTFSVEPWAEYQPDRGMCVADVGVDVGHAGKGKRVVFEALLDGEVLQDADMTLITGGRVGLLFGYEFPCDSEIELEITHVATLYDRKGIELVSVTETRLMDFSICECFPICEP